jgi:hypothetical protein
MQFESIKSAHCAFSTFGKALKNFVATDTFVVADSHFGAVDESYTGTFPETDGVQ